MQSFAAVIHMVYVYDQIKPKRESVLSPHNKLETCFYMFLGAPNKNVSNQFP